jgi:hypothetical protein
MRSQHRCLLIPKIGSIVHISCPTLQRGDQGVNLNSQPASAGGLRGLSPGSVSPPVVPPLKRGATDGHFHNLIRLLYRGKSPGSVSPPVVPPLKRGAIDVSCVGVEKEPAKFTALRRSAMSVGGAGPKNGGPFRGRICGTDVGLHTEPDVILGISSLQTFGSYGAEEVRPRS